MFSSDPEQKPSWLARVTLAAATLLPACASTEQFSSSPDRATSPSHSATDDLNATSFSGSSQRLFEKITESAQHKRLLHEGSTQLFNRAEDQYLSPAYQLYTAAKLAPDQALKEGSSGPVIVNLQELINALGVNSPIEVNGIFDQTTVSALRTLDEPCELDLPEGQIVINEELADNLEYAVQNNEAAAVKLLLSADPELRAAAIDTLYDTEDPTIRDRIADMLITDSSGLVRYQAAVAMGDFRDDRAISSLCEILLKDNGQVNFQSFMSLQSFPDSPMVANIFRQQLERSLLCADSQKEMGIVSGNIVSALRAMRDQGAKQFTILLSSDVPLFVDQGVVGLTKLGDSSHLDDCINLAKGVGPLKRDAIVALAEHVDNKDVKEFFLKSLSAEDTQADAVKGIQQISSRSSVVLPVLLEESSKDDKLGELIVSSLKSGYSDLLIGVVSLTKDTSLHRKYCEILKDCRSADVIREVCKVYKSEDTPEWQRRGLQRVLQSYISVRTDVDSFMQVLEADFASEDLREAFARYGTLGSDYQYLDERLQECMQHEQRQDRIDFYNDLIATISKSAALGIDFPLRYSKTALEEICSNLSNQVADGRPLAVMIYPKSDYNGAFTYSDTRNFVDDLIAHGYRVIVKEAASDEEAILGLRAATVDASNPKAKEQAQLIVWVGHGTENSIHLGNLGNDDSYKLDNSDADLMVRLNAAECLRVGGQMLNISCSNGHGRESNSNMGSFMRAQFPQAMEKGIITSEVPFGTFYWKFDKDNRLIDVKFTDFKSNKDTDAYLSMTDGPVGPDQVKEA